MSERISVGCHELTWAGICGGREHIQPVNNREVVPPPWLLRNQGPRSERGYLLEVSGTTSPQGVGQGSVANTAWAVGGGGETWMQKSRGETPAWL